MAYEVLARSRLFGLETPKDMFGVAQQLNLEVELSTMLRWEGVQVTQAMSPSPHLFLNTHPRENWPIRSSARRWSAARELARPGPDAGDSRSGRDQRRPAWPSCDRC